MTDQRGVEFLQWCLPKLGYQWKGFRKVRRQVCKRIKARLLDLDLKDYFAYRTYLAHNEAEWNTLDSLCYITISRFYRDTSVFETLVACVLPVLAQRAVETNEAEIRCWSAGCCAGEEPYTLQILWHLTIPPELSEKSSLKIVASDRYSHNLKRAKASVYQEGSIKELPQAFVREAFIRSGGDYHLKPCFRAGVEFRAQDIRFKFPEGEFDLVFCRNLVFTYFEKHLQLEMLNKIVEKLKPAGFLIIGAHESLPECENRLLPYSGCQQIYQKVGRRPGGNSNRHATAFSETV